MRNELQHIEKIEQYLNGTLPEIEKTAFENEIAQNTELQQQIANQKLIQQAAMRKAIRADVLKYGGSSGGFAWGKWMGILGGSILLIGLIWYFSSIVISEKSSKEITPEAISSVQQSEQINNSDSTIIVAVDSSILAKDSIAINNNANELTFQKSKQDTPITYEEDTHCDGLKTWVDPDIQEFEIEPSEGKTIEGKDGTLIIVPTDAFIYDDGTLVKDEVQLELVEALKVSDMLAYNLTTMNHDEALQTGGMIYVQSYIDGKKVDINPNRPLYIEIPTDDYNPDMMAWQGNTDYNGDINWESPTPLKKYLTIVDFDNLDFLPTGFEDAVAAGMPFKGHTVAHKELVDSLYYSIGGEIETVENTDTNLVLEDTIFESKSNKRLKIGARDFSIGPKYLKGKTVLIGQVTNQFGQTPTNASVTIYQNNKWNKKDVLTDKNGVFIFDKLETGNYSLYINDQSGNFLTSSIYISKGEDTIKIVDDLIVRPINNNFAVTKKGNQSKGELETDFIPENSKLDINLEDIDCECYISPQSIRTIKSPTFAQSVLATKEFEERLRILHQMPNAQVLFDLYVNNLEKDLHEIDAMVASTLTGENKKYFTDFAAQKLTNVLNANIYQDQLSNYYNNKKSEYSIAQQAAQKAYSKKSTQELKKYQQQLTQVVKKYNQVGNVQTLASSSNVSSVSTVIKSPRSSKLNISLPIGRTKLPKNRNVATSRNSYATQWYTGGWMNIDAYLHMVSKDPKEVSIEIGADKKQKGAKIYQFLNTLKTIIPISIIGTIGKVKFPKAGTKGASQMKNTYAIGIQRKDGKLFYAEERYNPYSLSTVDMKWVEVSENMLKENLQKLDGTGPLMDEIDSQQKYIAQQVKIKEQRAELKVEMDSIQSNIDVIEKELAKENVFLHSLKKVVNKCGVELVKSQIAAEDYVYEVVEIMPEFTGGIEKMYTYLAENVNYPKEAIESNINGKVYVRFVVYEDGSINNVEIAKSSHPLLDTEAKRVVENMPNWISGQERGKKVKVRYILPINFTAD